jgi:hypothetical protein
MHAARPHIYCLVPPARADELLVPLKRHFAKDPRLEVLIERRTHKGRPRYLAPEEQRHRRAPVAERDLLHALPRTLRQEADGLRFEQRMQPLGGVHQGTPAEQLITAIQDGDPDAASELWWRINERVRMRLRVRLGDIEAARAERHILGRILDDLGSYEHDPDRPYTAWLDDVVDRYAAERLAA